MKKYQAFLSGVIVTITAFWPILSTSYIALVLSLGWISVVIFPPLYVITTIALVRIYKDSDLTLENFIENKITNKRIRSFFLVLFQKSRYVALIVVSVILCPLITPLLAKLCIGGIKRVYIVASVLNFISTILWICFYLGGLEIIKSIFHIN